MSERLVIVIEYDVVGPDPHQALRDAMTQIREGADRLDPNHVKVVGVHVGVEDFVDRVLALPRSDKLVARLLTSPSALAEAAEGILERAE